MHGGLADAFEVRSDDAKNFAMSHYWDAAADLMVLLEARKE